MSDLNMPDRIFANFNPYDGRFLGFATANPLKAYKQIEYIRADLVDPTAIREAALREAMVALDRIVDGYALREDFRAEEIAMRCHATIFALIDKPAQDHSAGAGHMIDKGAG